MNTNILSIVIAVVMAFLLFGLRRFIMMVGKKRKRIGEMLPDQSMYNQPAEDKSDIGGEDHASGQSKTAIGSTISVEQFLEELRSHAKAEKGEVARGESGSVLEFDAKRRSGNL
jgi:hypothetical protein